MDQMACFCRSKAAEYTRRAEETSDRQIRKFLYLMRDNWIAAANDHERAAGAKASRLPSPRTTSLDHRDYGR
jgi:hypothetical protein